MIDYSQFAIPKPTSKPKEKKPLKAKKRLQSKSKPIPIELKQAVLTEKGHLCMCGYCFNCGGTAIVNEHDDGHHFPHRSKGGKDIVEHLWMAKHDCHMAFHDNPMLEREMFKQMEADGIPIVWKVESGK
jgi:hypothetical protein